MGIRRSVAVLAGVMCLALGASSVTEAREIRLLGPDGQPVAGAVAWITTPGAIDKIEADPQSGRLTLPDIGVEAACATAPGLQPIDLLATEGGEVTMRGGERLAGSVLTAGARTPVHGAIVMLAGDEALGPCARRALVDEEGQWLLAGLPPVTVALETVQAPGHLSPPSLEARSGAGRRLDIVLHRSCVITLSVAGIDAAPLPGVPVRFLPEWQRRPLDPPAWPELTEAIEDWKGVTDATGAVTLPALPWRAGWRVVAEHPALAPAAATVPADAPTRSANLTLRPGATLSLRVVDEDLVPLTGATARIIPVEGTDLDLAPASTTSGADGVVRHARIPPGRFALEVAAPGMIPGAVRGLDAKQGAALEIGDVVLRPGLTLRGTVTSDENPVVGAAIQVRGIAAAGKSLRSAESDSQGAFRFDGLDPALPTKLDVSAPGYRTVERELPAGTTEADIRMLPVRSLRIEVRDAVWGDPLADAGARLTAEAGQARFDAAISKDTASGADATAPATQHLSVESVPDGTYELTAWAPGHGLASRAGIVIDADGPGSVTIDLPQAHSIDGNVVDATTRGPIEGARMSGPHPAPVISGPDGGFMLDGIVGPFRLRAEHDAHLSVSQNVDPDDLPVGGLVIGMETGGSAEGVVVDAEGRPLHGAVIAAGGSRRAVTDADGRYRLDGLKPGLMSLVKTDRPVGIAGRETARVEIVAGRVTRCDFGRAGRIRGRVTRGDEPLAGATLSLQKVPRGGEADERIQPQAAATTDAEGIYELTGVVPGLHVLQARWGPLLLARDIVMPEGVRELTHDVEIRDLHVSGHVVNAETRAPLGGVSVRFDSPMSDGRSAMSGIWVESSEHGGVEILEFTTRPGSATQTAVDGSFTLSVPEPGPVSVSAQPNGYHPAHVSLDLVGSRDGVLLELKPKDADVSKLLVKLMDAVSRVELSGTIVTWGGRHSGVTSGAGRLSERLDSEALPMSIAAWVGGYGIAMAAVTAEDAEQGDVTRELALSPGGSVRLFVPDGVLAGPLTCAEDGPLRVTLASGFDIVRGNNNFCLNVGSRLATASADGAWTFVDLPPGPVTFSVEGLPPRTVDAVAREVVELDLR